MKNYFLILLAIFNLFACEQSTKSSEKKIVNSIERANVVIDLSEPDPRLVRLTNYGINYDISDQRLAELKIQKNQKFKEFNYSAPDSLTFYNVKQDLSNDSLLFYYSDTLLLFDTKSYHIDGKSWEVRKYYSDAGGIADGSYLLYFNVELGVIAVQSQTWGNFTLFTYNNNQISQHLKVDTVDFFNSFAKVPIN